MLGMGAPIMGQVCKVYAEWVIQKGYLDHFDDDLSLLNEFQKETISKNTETQTNPSTTYRGYRSQGISSFPIRQALLSSYIVMVRKVEDAGLLPPAIQPAIHNTCQHQTRAVLMKECSSDVVEHVMGSTRGVPITHLYIWDCGGDLRRRTVRDLDSHNTMTDDESDSEQSTSRSDMDKPNSSSNETEGKGRTFFCIMKLLNMTTQLLLVRYYKTISNNYAGYNHSKL